jgi:hypothetical protein
MLDIRKFLCKPAPVSTDANTLEVSACDLSLTGRVSEGDEASRYSSSTSEDDDQSEIEEEDLVLELEDSSIVNCQPSASHHKNLPGPCGKSIYAGIV